MRLLPLYSKALLRHFTLKAQTRKVVSITPISPKVQIGFTAPPSLNLNNPPNLTNPPNQPDTTLPENPKTPTHPLIQAFKSHPINNTQYTKTNPTLVPHQTPTPLSGKDIGITPTQVTNHGVWREHQKPININAYTVEFPEEEENYPSDDNYSSQLDEKEEHLLALSMVTGMNFNKRKATPEGSNYDKENMNNGEKKQKKDEKESSNQGSTTSVPNPNVFGQFCIGYYPQKPEEASPSMPPMSK